ncbi:MAG TPA: hypothetical protein VHF47_00635 [Acidimicrobiales bacterium]|nr:hypothetical protein [Acidimicrobiales bacterium]
MEQPKVELAGDAWVDLARSYLEERVGSLGDALHDVDFSLCEVFRNPPPHLDDGSGRLAWWFRIHGSTAEVGRGDRADVDGRYEVDYHEVLPRARLVYDLGDPSIAEMLRRQAEDDRRAREAAGKPPLELSPAVRKLLLDLHNFLAVRTA